MPLAKQSKHATIDDTIGISSLIKLIEIDNNQFEYWRHTQLTVNVAEGRGASFSLEIPLGIRFIIESKMFSEAELNDLPPVQTGASV